MTYGWAILIVLVAIAALYFLGVFSGKTPTTCNIEAPFNCLDSQSVSTTLSLQIGTLSSVKDVAIGGITITLNGAPCGTVTSDKTITAPAGGGIPSGGQAKITCTHNLNPDEKFNGEIIISYDNKLGLTGKTAKGTVSGQIR